jgi:hypothetical protein
MEVPTKALVMHDDYNEACGEWSMENVHMTIKEYKDCVAKIYRDNPSRFRDIENPFTIAEFGCATGSCSAVPIATIIEEVRNI